MSLPRVMHVDDDPDIRVIALLALEFVGGLSVVQCSSGEEALEKALEWPPDVFVLDVMMPVMTGVETYRALRAIPQFAATPVIFLTAKANANDVAGLRKLGANDVITKPFDPMTLAAHVIEVWNRAQDERHVQASPTQPLHRVR